MTFIISQTDTHTHISKFVITCLMVSRILHHLIQNEDVVCKEKELLTLLHNNL
jgi:hypothetical protein